MKKVLIIIFLFLIIFMSACASNAHEHTFSEEYSTNEEYHWHTSTCSHDVTSNKELHQFDDGVSKIDESTGEKVWVYTCKICGYVKKSGSEEKNTDNIRIAEEIIANVYDACTKDNSGVKAKKRNMKCSTLAMLLPETSDLSGSFYYDEINEAFYKVGSELLSSAFGLLEFFTQNGLPENDFSNKLYFNPHSYVVGINTEMSYTKITLISDKTLAIDVGHEHVILGEDGNIAFAMSYGYTNDLSSDYMDYLYFEYFSNNFSLIYQNATLNWKDEIDLAINYLKEAEDFSVLPLEIMKDMYLEDGIEKPINYHYDANNPNHVVLPTYDAGSFTAPGPLQEYFYQVHCQNRSAIPTMDAIVEDGVLKYVDGNGLIMLEIPDDVKIIDDLAFRIENNTYETYYFALFFHKADIEFNEKAFDMVSGIDSIFIDTIEKNENFEKQIKEHFPNVKLYYQNEWEIRCDLILPKVTIAEDDSDHKHIFTRQIQSEEYLAQEANCVHGICYYYVCELCDKHSNQFYEVGEKGEHNYVENDRYGDEIWYICTICGLQYGHNVNDTEHHFVLIEAVPATCTEDGHYLYRCKITGEEKIETQGKFHHMFAEDGTCIRCHVEKITYEEHDFYYLYVENLSSNLFVITMRCSICEDEYLQYSSFEDHIFENGICKDCHLIEHEHKFGKVFSVQGTNYHCCNICGFIEKTNDNENN